MKEFCVDLRLAKELEKNNFPQNSSFVWINYPEFANKQYTSERLRKTVKAKLVYNDKHNPGYEAKYCYSSPFADEILKELPNEIKDLNFNYYYHLKIEKSPIHNEMYFISYGITSSDRAWMSYYNTNDEKLSNALATMWMYLKKRGYIK